MVSYNKYGVYLISVMVSFEFDRNLSYCNYSEVALDIDMFWKNVGIQYLL